MILYNLFFKYLVNTFKKALTVFNFISVYLLHMLKVQNNNFSKCSNYDFKYIFPLNQESMPTMGMPTVLQKLRPF